jgi:hypothetical protein
MLAAGPDSGMAPGQSPIDRVRQLVQRIALAQPTRACGLAEDPLQGQQPERRARQGEQHHAPLAHPRGLAVASRAVPGGVVPADYPGAAPLAASRAISPWSYVHVSSWFRVWCHSPCPSCAQAPIAAGRQRLGGHSPSSKLSAVGTRCGRLPLPGRSWSGPEPPSARIATYPGAPVRCRFHPSTQPVAPCFRRRPAERDVCALPRPAASFLDEPGRHILERPAVGGTAVDFGGSCRSAMTVSAMSSAPCVARPPVGLGTWAFTPPALQACRHRRVVWAWSPRTRAMCSLLASSDARKIVRARWDQAVSPERVHRSSAVRSSFVSGRPRNRCIVPPPTRSPIVTNGGSMTRASLTPSVVNVREPGVDAPG